MSLHTLTSSLSWTPAMDTGQSSWTKTPACLQLSTVLLEDTISCDFPLAWSVPKTSSRRKWIRSLKNAKDVSELQMTSPYMATPRQNMMPTYEILCISPANTTWCSIHRKHMWRLNFLGCLYDANGVHPDLGKVDAVHALPAPTNITELQEFLGLVTYLSPFIPGLSTLTAPLQELLKKDTDFIWNHTYDTIFEWIKEAVISDTTLRYFDPSLPVTIQVDASQVGLGAALLQNGKPIAFASKALTETECQYTNIEREMLAAVFGAERFNTYIYGQSFMIESDHKPLESISRKNLADTPAQLQCMMLCLQGYDLTICYCPGKEMVIPDTLSWFSPWPGPDLPLDITIHHACIMPDHKEAFQQAFVNDPEMQALADLIVTGWPEDIKEVPHPLCPYWPHRETLTIKDGLVLQGEALIIPPAKRERGLHQLHQFHQGITKSQLLAHGSFFWPGINKAIEEVVCQCEACSQFQSQNAAAPLTPTPTPSCPWQMCATDIFMLEGIDLLVVGNFY